jgi:transcriptional regulator with XRE-family HTH domain
MSQTGYSQYETETNDVPIEKLKKLADFYHTSIDYILCMAGEKKPYTRSKKIK